jgi:hypothetical protein
MLLKRHGKGGLSKERRRRILHEELSRRAKQHEDSWKSNVLRKVALLLQRRMKRASAKEWHHHVDTISNPCSEEADDSEARGVRFLRGELAWTEQHIATQKVV